MRRRLVYTALLPLPLRRALLLLASSWLASSSLPLLPPCHGKVVDFRIKSRALSRALGDDDRSAGSQRRGNIAGASGDESAASPSTSEEEGTEAGGGSREGGGGGGGVALDLSGRFDVHLSAPECDDGYDDGLAPLFRVGGGRSVPSVYVGAGYDFNRAWYGLTRLVTTFRFSNRRVHRYSWRSMRDALDLRADGEPRKTERERRNNVFSRFLAGESGGSTAQIQIEKGLTSTDDYSAALSLEGFRWEGASPTFLSARFDTRAAANSSDPARSNTASTTTLAIGCGLHPRLDVRYTATLVLPKDYGALHWWRERKPKASEASWEEDETLPRPSGSFFASRVPAAREDSWIPQLRLNTLGQLLSLSEVGGERRDGRRVGARLVLRKQLDWSGGFDSDQDTSVRIEFSGMDPPGDVLTTVVMESVLERFLVYGAHTTITRERLFIL